MRILILNWRDIRNPLSGGAEILTHELAKRFVKNGHKVILFSSYFRGAKRKEIIEGVEIIREGHSDARFLFGSVQFKAYRYYKKNLKGQIDLVIDEIHGVPFFTVFYVKEKKVALICEVAGEIWDKAVKFPFNLLGKALEALYPIFYKNITILTISDSTKDELLKKGFRKVEIIPMGCSVPMLKSIPKKEKIFTLIFLGRLTKTKGIEDALDALQIVQHKIYKARIWILGKGTKKYSSELKKKIDRLRLNGSVKFFGFVSEKEKIRLLTKAHLLLTPSSKEGWGLIVHEAGARGTPVVSYNVPGLRDVVKNKTNGILCDSNNPKSLAENILKLIKQKNLYEKLQKGGLLERKKYSWRNTYIEINKIFNSL